MLLYSWNTQFLVNKQTEYGQGKPNQNKTNSATCVCLPFEEETCSFWFVWNSQTWVLDAADAKIVMCPVKSIRNP